MQKEIILQKGNKLGALFQLIAAGAFIVYAIFRVITGEIDILTFLFFVLGIQNFIIGFRIYKRPRIIVNEEEVVVRGRLFRSAKTIKLKRVKEISFGSYRIDFLFDDGIEERLKIDSYLPETSIAVKEAIQNAADKNGIPVIPG